MSIDVTYYSFIIVRISDTMVVVMAITNVWHSTAITMLTVFIIVVVRLSIYGKWSWVAIWNATEVMIAATTHDDNATVNILYDY